ncbi:MAG: conjugal transfer protein TraB [Desulfobacterales bacterium]|nr:conjugal transfer protein TraB [Desulfobacterales bacterium]MBF0395999.1 conjugal transfer protein TraB [Desulfobacterales bacterium]
MKDIEEHVLKASKEILVKFIEIGRVSPTTFQESFKSIYTTIYETIEGVKNENVKNKGGE